MARNKEADSMKLKAIYATQEEIPEGYAELYTERNDQWEFTGVEGVKTQGDIDRLESALGKERTAHKETKAAAKVWEGMDHDEVQTQLDRIPELEAAAGDDKVDANKINELVEQRIVSRLRPIERERDKAKDERDSAVEERDTMKGKDRGRMITDALRAAATKLKVKDVAVDDVLQRTSLFEVTDDGRVVTRDNAGVTPGLEADVWLSDQQEVKTHWWPASSGSGARGDGGGGTGVKNPWTAEHWSVTQQGKAYTSEGQAKAEQMAKAAGSSIGATSPPERRRGAA